MTYSQKFNAQITNLLVTLGCLIASILVPLELLDYLGMAAVLTVGLLHGANDIMLMNQQSNLQKKSFSTLKAIMYYTGIILLFAAIFYVFPVIGLFFFITISAIHFGEQHLGSFLGSLHKSIQYLLYTSYGLVVFMLIFYFNPQSTLEIITQMTGIKLSEDVFVFGGIISGLVLCGSTLYTVLVYDRVSWKTLVRELVILLLLGALFFSSSLLFSFAVYFVLWHSIPSMRDQLKFLYGTVSLASLKKYIRHAYIFWLFSVIGLFVLLIMIQGYKDIFLSVFFSFLAAITLPHVMIITKIKQHE